MARKRALLNNAGLRWAAALLLYGYYQLVLVTSRVRIRADPATEQLLRQGEPLILALWHRHVFFIPLLRRYGRRPLAVLVSGHRDGRIIAAALKLCRLAVVEGSSTRGGSGAYRQLLRLLRAGELVCITPDGPKGPPVQAKPGVIQLARQSGSAIVPLALAASRRRQLRSWDRTLVPLPFGRVVIMLGPPRRWQAEVAAAEQLLDLGQALDATAVQARELL